MNLFDNIIQSQFNNFTGKQEQPQVPSFSAPQAPRTSSYVAPNVPIKKESTSFFPQASAGTPIVTDDEIKQMMDKGASDDEIKILISELEKERGGSTPQAPQPEMSFGEKAGQYFDSAVEGGKNIVGGIVSEIPKVAGNIAGEVSNLGAYTPGAVFSAAVRAPFVKETYGELRAEQKQAGEPLKKLGAEGKKAIESTGLYDPESTGAKIGSFGTDILATVVGPGKIFKTAEKASAAIKALAGLANVSTQGTTAAVSNYVATEGRLPTAKEVAEFVAIQGGLGAVGGLFSQVKKLPSARLIPTTITEAGRDIRKGIDIGDAISKTGISFTKGQLVKKLETNISKISNVIDDKINTVIKEQGPNNITISSLTKGLKDKIINDPEYKKLLKGTPIDVPDIMSGIDETVDAYKKLFGNKKLDLNAQQELKKQISGGLEAVYNKSPLTTSKISARQATEKEIASTLRRGLEEKVPGIKELNEKLAPLLEGSKRLKSKGDYKTLFVDSVIGGMYASSQGSPLNDPVEYIKNFALGVLTKHIGTSTVVKTSASTILKKAEDMFKNPTFQKAILDQYRQLNSNQK